MRDKNRGMLLEKLINNTIDLYKKNDIAIIHKKDLSISFSKIIDDNGSLLIKNGRVKKKSTTDYYGIVNGKFLAFEAKSTLLNSLPVANIKEHQLNYLEDIKRHGGNAFLIVAFQRFDEFFIIKPQTIKNLSSKSLSINIARAEGTSLELTYPGILDFINKI